MIQDDVNKFLEYLEVDRGLSNNTLISYHFYLSRFVDFATSQGVHNVGQITQELIHRYRLYLNRLNNRARKFKKKYPELSSYCPATIFKIPKQKQY